MRILVDCRWLGVGGIGRTTELMGELLDPIRVPTVAIAEGRDPYFDCVSHLEDYIEDRIEASFQAPSNQMPVAIPSGCIEPTVSVAADALRVRRLRAHHDRSGDVHVQQHAFALNRR